MGVAIVKTVFGPKIQRNCSRKHCSFCQIDLRRRQAEQFIEGMFLPPGTSRVRCTTCSTAISWAIFCPLIASTDTFAFRSALYRLHLGLLDCALHVPRYSIAVLLIYIIIAPIIQHMRELKHDSHESLTR